MYIIHIHIIFAYIYYIYAYILYILCIYIYIYVENIYIYIYIYIYIFISIPLTFFKFHGLYRFIQFQWCFSKILKARVILECALRVCDKYDLFLQSR